MENKEKINIKLSIRPFSVIVMILSFFKKNILSLYMLLLEEYIRCGSLLWREKSRKIVHLASLRLEAMTIDLYAKNFLPFLVAGCCMLSLSVVIV